MLREQFEHALKHVVDGRGEPAAGTPTNAVWELPEVRAPVDVPAHIEKGLQQFETFRFVGAVDDQKAFGQPLAPAAFCL